MNSTAVKKRKYSPTIAMIVAMVLGIASGLVFGPRMGDIKFVGDVFFRLIQMGIVPFVMCQIIEAIGALSFRQLGSIGLKAIALFLGSSLLASAFGILTALVVNPGAGLSETALVQNATTDIQATSMTLQETVLGFFPSNIIGSIASGSMVPCIVFAVFFGVGIVVVHEANGAEPVFYRWVQELNQILLAIIRIVMNLAPIGIFAYVSASIGSLGFDILLPIGKYIVALAAGTAIFTAAWFIVIAVTCKMSIVRLAHKMFRMTVMAASTISSAVTLPVEMEDAKNRIGLDREVANLVLPLGVSINSNGSALHMALTAVFVSQMYDMEFAGSALITVCFIAWALSMANAVAPGASLISLTMLIPALGLPMDAIAILGGLEYIVAAIRTTLNVNSDVFCAILVAKSEGGIDYDVFNGDA